MAAIADGLRRVGRMISGAFSPRGESGLLERRDPASMRRPEVESDRVLMPATLVWLDLLPEYARPTVFCERFPRIVNQFATVWADRKLCKLYFETLMGDDRGGRAGFGPEVRKEIVRLRVYYETSMGDGAAEQDFRQRLAAANAARSGGAATSAGDRAAG
ncbi:MAG TPA: hypothetical protein VMU47_07805 [Caldimonas sp.]|nr:hypothetical protein [Caldimonas sp.]